MPLSERSSLISKDQYLLDLESEDGWIVFVPVADKKKKLPNPIKLSISKCAVVDSKGKQYQLLPEYYYGPDHIELLARNTDLTVVVDRPVDSSPPHLTLWDGNSVRTYIQLRLE